MRRYASWLCTQVNSNRSSGPLAASTAWELSEVGRFSPAPVPFNNSLDRLISSEVSQWTKRRMPPGLHKVGLTCSHQRSNQTAARHLIRSASPKLCGRAANYPPTAFSTRPTFF